MTEQPSPNVTLNLLDCTPYECLGLMVVTLFSSPRYREGGLLKVTEIVLAEPVRLGKRLVKR